MRPRRSRPHIRAAGIRRPRHDLPTRCRQRQVSGLHLRSAVRWRHLARASRPMQRDYLRTVAGPTVRAARSRRQGPHGANGWRPEANPGVTAIQCYRRTSKDRAMTCSYSYTYTCTRTLYLYLPKRGDRIGDRAFVFPALLHARSNQSWHKSWPVVYGWASSSESVRLLSPVRALLVSLRNGRARIPKLRGVTSRGTQAACEMAMASAL
jgi:hypothetical protein